MSRKFTAKRNFVSALMVAAVATQLFGTTVYAQQVVETTSVTQVAEEANKNARYLEVYFGIEAIPQTITWEFFNGAMSKVSEQTLEVTDRETGDVAFLEAVKVAVKAAQLEELALTYPESKVEETLDTYGITTEIETIYAAYIACALDTGLITSEQVEVQASNTRTIAKAEAIDLLMAVAEASGNARNFIGLSNEAEIYGKMIKAREEFVLFENEALQTIGEQAVMNDVTTGYNLRSNNYDANFIPELTLRYGHSTTAHATQLIGLLNSEGIVAKIQLEPKTSVFEYLPEWGEVPPATPDYRVQVVNEDLMLAHSLEYDLVLEFENQEDKLRFDAVVESYAKKNDDNQDGEGLLFASWWQPLYVSSVEMGEGYQQIYDNVITDGIYSLHPFCLPENKEVTVEGFKAIDADIEINQVKIWCNDAFFRYLNGDYQ